MSVPGKYQEVNIQSGYNLYRVERHREARWRSERVREVSYRRRQARLESSGVP